MPIVVFYWHGVTSYQHSLVIFGLDGTVVELLLLLLLLQPFYGPLDCVRDYLGEPVPER